MSKLETLHRLLEKVAETTVQREAKFINPELVLELNKTVGLSISSISVLLRINKKAVEYKLKVAQERQILIEKDDRLVYKVYSEDEFCDMPTEEKINHITRMFDRFLNGQKGCELSKERISALQVRLADLRKTQIEEIQEGKDLIIKILNVLLKDYVRNFKASYEAAFLRLKTDMAKAAIDEIWDVVGRHLEDHEDSNLIKDEIVNKLQKTIAPMGEEFDPVLVFLETGKNNSVLMDQVNKYLQTAGQGESHGFVGGGVVKDEASKVGGKQYRQKEIEEKRAEEQKGRSIV